MNSMSDVDVAYRSALLVLLQDSLITTAGSPMFSELVMKVKTIYYENEALAILCVCLAVKRC